MMTSRRKGRAAIGGLILVAGALAACSRSSTSDDTLKRDLDLAGSTSLELAPRSAGTQVISSIEETPGAVKAKAAAKARAPSKAPVSRKPSQTASVASNSEQPRAEANTTAKTEAASNLPATPAPSPTPVPTPQRRGGYKSIGEIIRNAPFPINP
jgi:hypothetical protein